MKPVAWLVHGFNVWDGGGRTVGRLQPFFERQGFEVEFVRYGWIGLAGVRLVNPWVAKRLAAAACPGDIAVGHSNGCAIIDQATHHHGCRIAGAVYINPALQRWKTPGPSVRWCHVWHSPSDDPVKWASRLRKWTPLNWVGFNPHPWGRMGADGYQAPNGFDRDRRMVNYNKESGFPPYRSREHSDVFANPILLRYFGTMMALKAAAEIPQREPVGR